MNRNLPPRATNWCNQWGKFIFCDNAMSEVSDFFNSIVLFSPGLLMSVLVIFLTVIYIITIGSLFLVLVGLNILNWHQISLSDHVRIQFETPWMRRDLIVALYFFLFHDCGAPIDPTLSSRCDTIGTNHIWTKLWFLTWINDDLSILLIRKRNCNGRIYHLLIATWVSNSYNTNDLFSLGNVLWDCFGNADLLNS